MAKIFITGSSDGLGLLAAEMLIKDGHDVLFHARNSERAEDTRKHFRWNVQVLTADLSDMEQTKQLALDVNAAGKFDAIIHNAGVYREPDPVIFRVNTLAPYILTCMINKPQRLIYISSGLHTQGKTGIKNLTADKGVDYPTSKLQVLMLALAFARICPGIYVNAVNPGWVPTKMGGAGAPDDLLGGARTQVWLASASDAAVTGRYMFHMKEEAHSPKADNEKAQRELLVLCEQITGIGLPEF